VSKPFSIDIANQLDRISLRTEKLVHSGRQRKITRVTKRESSALEQRLCVVADSR
jgi:hypothetical protein